MTSENDDYSCSHNAYLFVCLQAGRAAVRAEERLSHLRTQAASRESEGRKTLDILRSQLMRAESLRSQQKARADQAEAETARLMRESEAERMVQESQLTDMLTAYKRVEKLACDHLSALCTALQLETGPVYSA
jgi:hypothetical protein